MNFTPHTPDEVREMLQVCGVSSIAELFKDIPLELRAKSFDLPAGRSEMEIAGKAAAWLLPIGLPEGFLQFGRIRH